MREKANMDNMLSHAFLLLAGVSIYAGIQHFLIGLENVCNKAHRIFAIMCWLLPLFLITHFNALKLNDINIFVEYLRANIAIGAIQLVLFPFFIAYYTHQFNKPFLVVFTVLFSVLFISNLIQPYTLQYTHIDGFIPYQLPWHEVFYLPMGESSIWFKVAFIAIFLMYAYMVYELVVFYQKTRKTTALIMIFVLVVYVFSSLHGLLIRLSILNNAPPLGAFGYLGLILAMSVVLNYERRQEADRLKAVLDHVPAAVYIKDLDSRYLMVNKYYQNMFHIVEKDIIGRTDEVIFSKEQAAALKENDQLVLLENNPMAFEESVTQDGETHIYYSQKFPLYKDNVTVAVCGISTDISERKKMEARLQSFALQDALTGLPNRIALQEKLATKLQTFNHNQSMSGALLIIDLDHFKTVNNALTHDVGDKLLQEVAKRLAKVTPDSVYLARLGGDEFAMLLENSTNSEQESEKRIHNIAMIAMKMFSHSIAVGDHVLTIGASMGITSFSIDNQPNNVANIFRHAELALYNAKSLGRNTIQFFRKELQERVEYKLKLEEGLRSAITNHELTLSFQPQVDQNGKMVGAEVLLRWQHPELGHISPATFIPVAEEAGIINVIGAWVMDEAAKKLSQWLNASVPFVGHIAINVSAWQFSRPDFIARVRLMLAKYAVPANYFMFEITESVLLYDLEQTIKKLHEVHELGIKISLDDFGTGYSSLAYLKNLPLDELKIDKTFVDALTEGSDHNLIQTIIAIGEYMHLSVIAEGVETNNQSQQLKAFGCERFQGYLFSQPLVEKDFITWVHHNYSASQ